MPKKPKPRITQWSYSRWAAYEQCPFKAKCQFIDKIPEEKGPALIRGQEIHDKAEKYCRGELKKLPKELELFEDEFEMLKQAYKGGWGHTEQLLNFAKDWTHMSDKWSKNIWVRIKMDFELIADSDGTVRIIDYKTGKVKTEGYKEQLELYALAGFMIYDEVYEIHTELWFLDHGEIIGGLEDTRENLKKPEGIYKLADVPKLKKNWEARVKRMLNDERFDPSPNEFCKWCSFQKSKGGPCKF